MAEYNIADLAEKIIEKLKKGRSEMAVMNLMILGKTGVGKSTLINNLFNENIADVGVGRPVTQQIKQYKKEGFPLTIYDTPGLELGGDNSLEKLSKGVNDEIRKGINSGDPNKAIHCVLYCVSATSHRFEEKEIQFIKNFLNENKDNSIPVIIVITQAISDNDVDEITTSIRNEHLGVNSIVPVLAQDYTLMKNNIIRAHGLDKLAETISEVLPDSVRKTFISIQKASIKLKTTKAHVIVVSTAATAAATGAIPIPIADSFILIPEQAFMMAGITSIFGFNIDKSTIITLISAALGTTGTTLAGKNLVSLIKLIPGAGQIAGGVISGSVAAALTAALGEAYIAIMVAVAKGEMNANEIGTAKGKKYMINHFKSALKKKRNEQGEIIE